MSRAQDAAWLRPDHALVPTVVFTLRDLDGDVEPRVWFSAVEGWTETVFATDDAERAFEVAEALAAEHKLDRVGPKLARPVVEIVKKMISKGVKPDTLTEEIPS